MNGSWLALPLGALLSMASAAEQPPATTDFAWGMDIEVAENAPLHELPLPLAVYRRSARPDLGDLRVFNAVGDVVPHGLLPAPLTAPPEARRMAMSGFPFESDAAGDGPRLDVRIAQDEDGTRVEVRSDSATLAEAAWVVDARSLRETPRALLLDWPASHAPFTRRVVVEGSHDLARWYRLGGESTLADVTWAGERLRAARLPLRGTRHAWYRVRSIDGRGPLPPLSFEAELAPRAGSSVQREWLGVDVQPLEDGALRFDTPAALPVERVRVEPVDRNSFARLTVRYRREAEDSWRHAGEGVAYRLDFDGSILASAPLEVRASGARAWRLEADDPASGAGFGRQPPRVSVGWTPRSLVFLARGEGPYTLAFGSRRVAPALADGLTLLGDDVDIVQLPVASATGLRALAEPSHALSPPSDVDWKRLALWAVLVAGALLLVAMAVRLLSRRG